MPVCDKCGEELSRRRRGPGLKIFALASFRCPHCGDKTHLYRPFFGIFRRWSNCPLCHNGRLVRRNKADKIDRMSANPLRRSLALLGFPLYHCTFCRYQFRDWRSLQPNRDNRLDGSQS